MREFTGIGTEGLVRKMRTDNRPMRLRQAIVDSVSGNMANIRLADTDTPVPARYLGWYSPMVGDSVWVLENQPDLLVLGRLDTVDNFIVPGVQSNGFRSFLPMLQNELAYWGRRGHGMTTWLSSGVSISGSLGNLTDPSLPGASTLNVSLPSGGGQAVVYFNGTGFDSWADGGGRRAWLQNRSGPTPSRIRVRLRLSGDTEIVVDDQNPQFDGGFWVSPSIVNDDFSLGNIWSIDQVGFILDYEDSGTARIRALGWSHRNIPIGWNSILFGHDTGWIGPPTFLNGWGQFSGGVHLVRYRRRGELVEIRGLVNGGSAVSVFELPEGFRPVGDRWLGGAGSQNSSNPAALAIRETGMVQAINYTNHSQWYSVACQFLVG